MMQLPIGPLLGNAQAIAQFGQLLNLHPLGEKLSLSLDDHARFTSNVERLENCCARVGLHTAAGIAGDLLAAAKAVPVSERTATFAQIDAAHVRCLIVALNLCLMHEGKTKVALVLPPSAVPLYDQTEPLFGQEVSRNFPCLAYDVGEAGKCLALGRSTAAAFHALRCLEAGFAALWRCIGVADPIDGFERNWSNRLRKVQAEMESRWPVKSGRMSGDAPLFDSVVGAIVGMQNPYRNNTMHFNGKYTEDEARQVVDLVTGIMRKIASRMDENGEPKVP